MNMKRLEWFLLAGLLVSQGILTNAAAGPETSATGLDPYTRDEDISASKLTVEVEQRADGLYEYVYSIDAPEINKGIISSLYIDLTCDRQFDQVELPDPGGSAGYSGNRAEAGSVTPTAVLADFGSAAKYGIAEAGFASFLMYQKPGQQRSGMRLISPAEPGLRSYVLTPAMDNTPEWDYPETPDPDIPWVEDFTVAGRIAAPGCPGLVDPVENPSFPGSREKGESESSNELLRYETPMQDRLHADAGSLAVTILYSEDIDPATFRVEPAHLRKHFEPLPGTRQEAELPIGPGRTQLRFEVRTAKPAPEDRDKNSRPDEGKLTDRDVDVFEVRNTTPGKGNDGAK